MLENIEVFLQKQLPDELGNHCHANNLDNKCLILMVDSAAWSSKLRFLQPALEQAMHQQYPDLVSRLKIKVRPAAQSKKSVSKNTTPRRPELSNSSRQIIQDMAESLEESDLKNSLLRLAKTGKQ